MYDPFALDNQRITEQLLRRRSEAAARVQRTAATATEVPAPRESARRLALVGGRRRHAAVSSHC